MPRKRKAAKQKAIFGKRIRTINTMDGIATVEVKPGNGPKPQRYPFACCAKVNDDCIRCRVPPFAVARGMR